MKAHQRNGSTMALSKKQLWNALNEPLERSCDNCVFHATIRNWRYCTYKHYTLIGDMHCSTQNSIDSIDHWKYDGKSK